jgi:hypothetical protein
LFTLTICDEAHRCTGHTEGLFSTVLNRGKIKSRKRLFMTATPRYFADRVKKKADDLEYELASMDDEKVFGPSFHELSFNDAISADPPLLTDYQVVIIGVTDSETRRLAEQAHLVRTKEGLETDARTFAAQIGLAKAMRKHDLRKIITFHSSVRNAVRFTDPKGDDSFSRVLPHLSRSSRPTGKLQTYHISGRTPAGRRATLLKKFGELPDAIRGILSNCSCLGEGVDVPVLDGVAFIDPKRSTIAIIQAVGRVMRKAEGKTIGTIVIPVFVDEHDDAEEGLERSAFEPVWKVLRALRAHDHQLAVELDELRLKLGRHSSNRGRIHLPDKIQFDLPRLLPDGFEQSIYVRTVEGTTAKPPLTIDGILKMMDDHEKRTGSWPNRQSGTVPGTEEKWGNINQALAVGMRGLPGGSSLPQLLQEHRGVRNIQDLPPLTIKWILEMMDDHEKRTGSWPNRQSGTVPGNEEKWGNINQALAVGMRGLPGGSSLAKLRRKHFGK